MTDTEINEAVARKLGWNLNATGGIGVPPHRSMGFEKLPDYCHSIEAAWEIVEQKDPAGYQFELVKTGKGFRCSWFNSSGNLVCLEADTAPMAICKAFLKLP